MGEDDKALMALWRASQNCTIQKSMIGDVVWKSWLFVKIRRNLWLKQSSNPRANPC